jgi:sec-independent protein translocase protein TatA
MGMPGGMEWILIALVVLLLFGGKKIPELAKGLGSGIRNFKDGLRGLGSDAPQSSEIASTDRAKDAGC